MNLIGRHEEKAINEIGKVFYHGTEIKERDNWIDTFDTLSDAMPSLPSFYLLVIDRNPTLPPTQRLT